MNTKWKTLMVQAIRECYPDDGDNGAKDKTLQRFSELMVKECADAAFDFWCGPDSEEKSAYDHILKHFGIEQ